MRLLRCPDSRELKKDISTSTCGYAASISYLVPRQTPWAPKARAATYPRASTIPPEATTEMLQSETRSTTLGSNVINAS
jgi:hypothetical protein